MEAKRKSSSGEPPSSQSPAKKQSSTAPLKYLDASTVQACFDKGVISKWEHTFYTDNLGKDSLSQKQVHFKELVELKVNIHAAKEKRVLNDFEQKFTLDNFGKAPEALSEKQLAVKKVIDNKLSLWRAFSAGAISDVDLEFMVSNFKRETWTPKQQPIKDRIEKQLEAASAFLDGQVLDNWELGFFKDNVSKDCGALSAKQQPIMDRILKKIQAWRAYQAGLLNKWALDFVKDVAGKATLSEKQQKKLREIEETMSATHSSDEELANIPLPVST